MSLICIQLETSVVNFKVSWLAKTASPDLDPIRLPANQLIGGYRWCAEQTEATATVIQVTGFAGSPLQPERLIQSIGESLRYI